MRRLSNRFTCLSVVTLLTLVGCQSVQPSQEMGAQVDQLKVASALDKYQAVRGDWAEQYANLSVEEMKAFIDLGYQRALNQFEAFKQNPVEEQDVMLSASGKIVERYDPAGRIETRTVRLTGKGLSQRRAEIEQDYRFRLALHELSVARYGVSFNAVNGKQLDSLNEDARIQTLGLSAQQSCISPTAYPSSSTVPYSGVISLPRTMGYIGQISDPPGCDPFYIVSGTSSITRLSQNPFSSERCISRLAGLPAGQNVTRYARRRSARESASRYIIGPGSRIYSVCGFSAGKTNWARSARAN